MADQYEIVCPDGVVRHYPYRSRGDAVTDARLFDERRCNLYDVDDDPRQCGRGHVVRKVASDG